MDTKGKFYLGRSVDAQSGKTTPEALLYRLDDLTTHAVVVGMTGSGKTGLCIDLLEEAALNQIPALMIDPKGDITNLLLQFPDLLPTDFQPWLNPDVIRQAGKSPQAAAEEIADQWRTGLAEWDIQPERIQALKEAAHFAVYTPGSDSGLPVSILSSLAAPGFSWDEHREELREQISGTAIAILGLVGLQDIDPVRSREHILLANIFEHAWSHGRDLDLATLILQTQNPPFQKLGVFDVNTFFPEKDRFELAMLLNNILAAPAFQSWIEGEALDIARLLYAPDGRPRHTIFYIAHLTDSERMFFVTLLYSAIEAWMRAQTGTTTLRAIVYFDEIFGYLPPISNPPSKIVMLRMLKQARAFGVGQVLVTQNPVDLDYKGLSNAGTWMVGKLQTERDKERLLDGLQGAMSGSLDRNIYDRMISQLGKRVFLLHNVHRGEPGLFQTRWAMSYLAGPLTRAQIPQVNRLAGANPPPPAEKPEIKEQVAIGAAIQEPARPRPVTAAAQPASIGLRPALPQGIREYFLPANLSFTQAFRSAGKSYPADTQMKSLVYHPILLAQATVRYLNRKYDLDYEQHLAIRVSEPDRRGVVRWDEYPSEPINLRNLDTRPEPEARFGDLLAPLNELKTLNALERDFLDWVYRSSSVQVRANPELELFAGPDVTEAEFRTRCSDAARRQRDLEMKTVDGEYKKKIAALNTRLAKSESALEAEQAELSNRSMEEWSTHADNVLRAILPGRKTRLSTSMSKRRMTSKAKEEVKQAKVEIAELQKQLAALEQEKVNALDEVNQRWGEIANQIEEINLTPLKKDVFIDVFGVGWVPYYLAQTGDESFELPAFNPPQE